MCGYSSVFLVVVKLLKMTNSSVEYFIKRLRARSQWLLGGFQYFWMFWKGFEHCYQIIVFLCAIVRLTADVWGIATFEILTD